MPSNRYFCPEPMNSEDYNMWVRDCAMISEKLLCSRK